MTKRIGVALAGLFAAVALLAGCGGHKQTSYYPSAYGEGGACYYLDDPYEARILVQDGRCQSSWAPTPMPYLWRARYADYYDSPSYYTRYVVVEHRTVYVQRAKTWEQQNKSTIDSQRGAATYVDPKGKKYTGLQVSKKVTGQTSVGGGDRKTGVGGGDRGKKKVTSEDAKKATGGYKSGSSSTKTTTSRRK